MELLNLKAGTTEQVLPFPHTFPKNLLDISYYKKIPVLVHSFPECTVGKDKAVLTPCGRDDTKPKETTSARPVRGHCQCSQNK